MGGRHPIAYTPFGELTVFVFFGLVAVVGAYYVQAGSIAAAAWLAAAAIGMHAAAVLLVNNYRDRAHDAATGRRTLAPSSSAAAALRLYAALLVVPFALVAGDRGHGPAAAGSCCRWSRCRAPSASPAALPAAPRGSGAERAAVPHRACSRSRSGCCCRSAALLHRVA